MFGPKPSVNPFEKMSIIRHFELYTLESRLFILEYRKRHFPALQRRFFVVQYRKRHFPGLYSLKNKSWENGHFWTKTIG